MTTPFTLLLPVYAGDQAAHLRAAFHSSVEQQTLPPAEVVIVRDGPVPEEIADELSALRDSAPVPVRVVELERNVGLAAALEAGLAASTHDVVARMDADDLSMPERFAQQIDALEAGLDLVGSGLVEFEGSLDTPGAVRTPPIGAAIPSYARFHQPFNHPTVVYRRSVVAGVGGYAPMGRMEDYWLFARMIHAGARVDNVPQPLLGYRVDSGAYGRRGGLELLRSEVALQKALRGIGFTTRAQQVRNLAVRGGYRLVPEGVRRVAYRSRFTS
ncbi:glycosyltransferase [Demequina capsici]|uniref:Glycosyltransferase n=1 Tax=Demequina capsici TaxID=3075620 RepID=A0AA96FEL3_9MICO|nr:MULTISPECIES: glycosyltransferase [unclassified Demequina]WNM24369.1 glycosyltransferase [Demequina sp. OYTSA14]WNM27191.1 glycosyltransferase [Demequina sp. PMTSA13]